ncbi:PefC/AfrB family outer membrane usher protein [Salmonella enterica subsp. houtenae serovar 44:z36,[z38]:-]|nr:PefC/AfrB family outer membrane usher protein [Salmonella enterica subsp. houtenae serovar 44:z36,[z38]:-]
MRIYLKPTLLACLISSPFSVQADSSDLNLDFIQGSARENVPDILTGPRAYPAGQYVVDVQVNREDLGRHVLMITPEDAKSLCLSPEWIREVGIPVRLEKFTPWFNTVRQCYVLSGYPGARVDFDYGMQVLKLSIPQVVLQEKTAADNWDYGIPGFRLTWSGNASKTARNNEQVYGNFDLNANIGRWVLSGQTNGFNGQGFRTPQAILSTALGSVRGTLLMGKSQTASTLLPDFGFYGVALRSDSAMVPWTVRGYAPVISGVVGSTARITVTQGGYTLSSQMVPPGAYSLNNITPTGNGDITVTVEEESGARSVHTYPVTTLPTLLRAGDFNYNLVVGTRADDIGRHREVKGPFTLASLDYGFDPLTLNTAVILHEKYQSAGIGMTRDFGLPGALALSVNASHSVFDNDPLQSSHRRTWNGVSTMVKYAKGLTTFTNLQLLTYRYTGEKYVDFAEFRPGNLSGQDNRRERYEAIITQSIGRSFISLSGWTQSYRNHNSNDIGANLSYNTTVGPVSLSLSGNYGKYNGMDGDDYGGSLSLSLPFSAFDRPHYSSSSIGYSRNGKTTFNTGVSGNLNEWMNYSLNSGVSRNTTNASAYVGMSFDALQTGMSVSQSDNRTSMSVSGSGSVIGTAPTGILFTREQNSTLAIARLKGIQGVSFNGSRPTNKNGDTVLYMTPYNVNDIRIDTEQVPDNIELMNSVYSVVPTEKAIVYREFKHVDVKRYILRVMGRDGKALPAGSQAKTEQGLDAGFVSGGGVLLVNLLSEPKSITVRQQNGQTCTFSMKGMVAGENKTREVRCE